MMYVAFLSVRKVWSRKAMQVLDKYGPVVTFWIGNKPLVAITDIDITSDILHKIDIAGKPKDVFCKFFS